MEVTIELNRHFIARNLVDHVYRRDKCYKKTAIGSLVYKDLGAFTGTLSMSRRAPTV